MANKLKVIVACEFSGVVRDAFRRLGHEAYSCCFEYDPETGQRLQSEGEFHQFHLYGDCLHHMTSRRWDMMIAHPPCTYLTNAGVRHLHSIKSRRGNLPKVHGHLRWEEMRKAAAFFSSLLRADIPRIAVENPVPHRYAVAEIGRKYDQIVQPWHFGHREMKATCFWLMGMPVLQPTAIVGPPPKNKEERKSWQRVHRESPGRDRWKRRSVTYPGIAAAMAEQWGRAILAGHSTPTERSPA